MWRLQGANTAAGQGGRTPLSPPPPHHGDPPATPSPSHGCPNSVPGREPAARGARQLNTGRSRIPAEPIDSEPGANGGTSQDPGCRVHKPGGARAARPLPSHYQAPGGKSPRAAAARLASAQPLDPGPFESRCSEPQPPAGFCAGLSVESTFPSLPRTTAPEGIWEGRVPGTLLRLRAS